MAPRENGLIRQPVTLEIAGSSPAGVAKRLPPPDSSFYEIIKVEETIDLRRLQVRE